MDANTDMAFLGRCKCGGFKFVATDTPDLKRTINKDTMAVLRMGGTVTRQTVAETKRLLNAAPNCTCGKEPKQPMLFEEAE